MKKSKLFLAVFLIASLGASAGENSFIDDMEKNIIKRGEAQANYNEASKKYDEIQDEVFDKNQEFEQEFSNLRNISKNLWNYNPDYFKNLDDTMKKLKTKNTGNQDNLNQLKKIEDFISFTKEATLKLADANLKYETKYDPIWDGSSLNGDLEKVSLGSKKSFDRIFKKVKERTELIKKYEDRLKTATDKYEIDLTNALLGNRKHSLERWKENIKKIADASGDSITFEDFEKAVKDPAEKEKLKKRIENGKVGEYFEKENAKIDELKSIGVDIWGEYVEDENGRIIETPTENDKVQNTGILENRLLGIQLEKNLNKEIEKNKTENKKLTDSITANKNLIDSKADASSVYTKTEADTLLKNKADKSSLTEIGNKVKANTDNIVTNKNDIKTNTTNISNNSSAIAENKKSISDEVIARKNDVKSITEKVTNNSTKINENKKTLTETKVKVEANKTNITNVKNEVKENKTLIDSANTKITNNFSAIAENEKSISNEVIARKNDIKSITEKVVDNSTKISENKKTLTETNGKVEANKTNIANVKNEVKENKTLIEKTEKKVETNTKNITNITTKITEIEKIKKLENVEVIHNSIAKNRADISENKKAIKNLDKKTSAGIASVAAMSVLDFNNAPVGRVGIGAAIGGYRSKQAVAVGIVYGVSEDFKVNGKVGLSTDSLENSAWGVSGTYYFK